MYLSQRHTLCYTWYKLRVLLPNSFPERMEQVHACVVSTSSFFSFCPLFRQKPSALNIPRSDRFLCEQRLENVGIEKSTLKTIQMVPELLFTFPRNVANLVKSFLFCFCSGKPFLCMWSSLFFLKPWMILFQMVHLEIKKNAREIHCTQW